MATRGEVKSAALASMIGLNFHEQYDAAEHGRGFIKHIYHAFPELVDEIIAAEDMTEEQVQRSSELEALGKDVNSGMRVLVHLYPEEQEFHAYATQMIRLMKGVRHSFWNKAVYAFLSYLQSLRTVSDDGLAAWERIKKDFETVISQKDDAREGSRTIVLTDLFKESQEGILAQLNKFGRLIQYQGLLVPSDGTIDGTVCATYAYEQSAKKALDEMGAKNFTVSLFDKPPKRNNLRSIHNCHYFCYNYAQEGDDEEEEEASEEPEDEYVPNPDYIAPKKAEADCSKWPSGLESIQANYNYGGSSDEDSN